MGQVLEIPDTMYYSDVCFNLFKFDLTYVLKKFGVKFLNSSSITHEIELPNGWFCVDNHYVLDENNFIRGRFDLSSCFVVSPKYRIFSYNGNVNTISLLQLDVKTNKINYIPCSPTLSSWKEAEYCLYRGCPIYKTDDIYLILTSYWYEEIYFN